MKKNRNIFELQDESKKNLTISNNKKEYIIGKWLKQLWNSNLNILLRLILALYLVIFYILFYPLYLIFTSEKLNTILKIGLTLLYLLMFLIFGEDTEQATNIFGANEEYQIVLSVNSVEIYQNQSFTPNNYVSSDIELVEIITSTVDVKTPGEYYVTYKNEHYEEQLKVIVLEDPITLTDESIQIELGENFNPEDLLDLGETNIKDIDIENRVDLTKPGTYSIIYSFDNVEKTVQVVIAEPKTAEYIIDNTTWLTDKIQSFGFSNHEVISVDGGNLSGSRESNVGVDVGFGDREYWAFTNEHGQLVAVLAESIILQDEANETLLGDGRYYTDEAKVPGTEESDLDEGHVIADSLGGVSNAYNITPQNSTLNRYGDQAYMESVIRTAGGVTNFVAIITYPNTVTQIPSHYSYTYVMKGNIINDEFDNINPEKEETPTPPTNSSTNESSTEQNQQPNNNITSIDKNGNGTVTIKEAEDAGYSMPIYSDHWLYPYMIDRDNDGMVGD